MLSASNLISFSIIPSYYEIEVVTVKIMLKFSFILCVVYAPPHSNDSCFNSRLDYLDHVLSQNVRTSILSDFNFPDID